MSGKPRGSKRITKNNVKFRFDPKSTMTVWEFARFMSMLVDDKPIHFKTFLQLPAPLQRHFRRSKNAR
jgi:hypothetical protein